MSIILNCKHSDQVQPYIGVDPTCNKPAVFCIEHDPHKNKQGLLHQMMPLSHFRRTINQKKFKMGDKVAVLIQQYSNFMDELIKQITELKLRKIVELSMLWLRQLASNQQQYQNLRKLYRNDYEGLSCKDIHLMYFKVVTNQSLDKQKIEDIQCYKDMCKVMNTLQQSVKARLMITQKISELEGVVQKGELLRRALPDRKALKQNTKEILLQVLNTKAFDLKYNIITIKQNCRNFQSIFSKYPLIQHTNYHLLVKTKYSNILVGICNDQVKASSNQNFDLHYSQHSIVYNCSNGCIYRDGMFESSSAHLTKGQKELQLIFRITDMEMLILMGKNVVCRVNIEKFKKNKLFLHMLMRTQGDSIQIDRDRFLLIPQQRNQGVPSIKQDQSVILEHQQSSEAQSIEVPPPPKMYNRKNITSMQQKPSKHKEVKVDIKNTPMVQSFLQKKQGNLNELMNLAQSIPLSRSIGQSLQLKKQKNNIPKSSKVFIQIEQSLEPQQVSSKYTSNIYDQFIENKKEKGSLINPAVLPHLKKSQFQASLKSSNYNLSPIPSAQLLQKIVSGTTQKNSEDWL